MATAEVIPAGVPSRHHPPLRHTLLLSHYLPSGRPRHNTQFAFRPVEVESLWTRLFCRARAPASRRGANTCHAGAYDKVAVYARWRDVGVPPLLRVGSIVNHANRAGGFWNREFLHRLQLRQPERRHDLLRCLFPLDPAALRGMLCCAASIGIAERRFQSQWNDFSCVRSASAARPQPSFVRISRERTRRRCRQRGIPDGGTR